jgi:hypothetical protein
LILGLVPEAEVERSRYFKMFHVEQFGGLAVKATSWAIASRGVSEIVPRREIVPRGTIVKIDTGVGGDLRRIPGVCARILNRARAPRLRVGDPALFHKPAQSSAIFL